MFPEIRKLASPRLRPLSNKKDVVAGAVAAVRVAKLPALPFRWVLGWNKAHAAKQSDDRQSGRESGITIIGELGHVTRWTA